MTWVALVFFTGSIMFHGTLNKSRGRENITKMITDIFIGNKELSGILIFSYVILMFLVVATTMLDIACFFQLWYLP